VAHRRRARAGVLAAGGHPRQPGDEGRHRRVCRGGRVTARIGLALLPGALFDDAARAVRMAGAEPVLLWYRVADLRGVDAVVVSGGATYGNYLRVGALARTTPMIGAVIDAAGEG